jgi:hypothetical protein
MSEAAPDLVPRGLCVKGWFYDMSYSFQAPCGCVASLDDGQREICPVHEAEGVDPEEALAMFLRIALLEETEEQAKSALRAAKDSRRHDP